MRFDSALTALNPPIPDGSTAASEAPASIKSASPFRM